MKTYTIDADNDITQYASAGEAEAEAVINTERFSTSAGLAELAEKWPSARLIEIWNGLSGVAPVKKFTDRKTAVLRIWKVIENFSKVASAPAPTLPEATPAPGLTPPPSDPTPTSTPLELAPEPAPAGESAPLILSAPVPPIDAMQAAPAPQAADELVPEQTTAAIVELQTHPEPATPAAEPEAVAPVGTQAADVVAIATSATKRASRAKKTHGSEPKPETTRQESKTDRAIAMMKQPGGITLMHLMDAFGWQAHSVRGFVSGTLGRKMGLTVLSAKNENGERTYSISA